ncbi:MAG: hypothetical protein ACM3OB_08340 [Acidobacteriota bacterium]
MSLAAAESAAREGRLYPAVILHGGSVEARRAAALGLARLLLCEAVAAARPCGVCRHCRRIAWPGEGGEVFHPDFTVVQRDLKTSTSVEAARGLVQAAQSMPFEARGQVFVIAEADTLSGEAANALLKLLEEPPSHAPRHFLLLCPSRLDLLPTLRSRSLAIYLGPAEAVDPEAVERAAARLGGAVDAYVGSGAAVYILAAAGALAQAADFADPRAGRPWAVAAAAALRASERPGLAPAWRRALLALAEDLLGGGDLRLRGIGAERILEGLLARRLAAAEIS